MRNILNASVTLAGQILRDQILTAGALATLCAALIVPPIFAQAAPVFVLPSLDGTPAPHPPSTSQPPASAPAHTGTNSFTAPTTTLPSALPVARPANYPAPKPASNPAPKPAPNSKNAPAAAPADSKHHPQPEVSSALATCRKRYADAVYNIGLALWTAPPPQHRVLERLLNASAAAQAAAMDPNPTDQSGAFCSDTTLNDLEATVVRLKAKGWVPMTDVEEHVTHTTNVNDELKHAIAGVSN